MQGWIWSCAPGVQFLTLPPIKSILNEWTDICSLYIIHIRWRYQLWSTLGEHQYFVGLWTFTNQINWGALMQSLFFTKEGHSWRMMLIICQSSVEVLIHISTFISLQASSCPAFHKWQYQLLSCLMLVLMKEYRSLFSIHLVCTNLGRNKKEYRNNRICSFYFMVQN